MTTPSTEQAVKETFARQYVAGDWTLLKSIADGYLQQAVFLKTADVRYVSQALKLLARNSLKRLYIGVGTELLLKAAYLKRGFLINRLERDQPNAPRFPFTAGQARGFTLSPDETYKLDDLIRNVNKVLAGNEQAVEVRGLEIAKVFRNKEGHGVLPRQQYMASHYRDIEQSLVSLYQRAFGETLRLRFSMVQGEKGVWRKGGI